MTKGAAAVCQWCERPFLGRRGGSPQRFCCAAHRMAFWSALRRCAERAIADGILTIADIRNSAPRSVHASPGRQLTRGSA